MFSFIDLAQTRTVEIQNEYGIISKTLEAIKRGTELAGQLKGQLEHEKRVLEQKKQVNLTINMKIVVNNRCFERKQC